MEHSQNKSYRLKWKHLFLTCPLQKKLQKNIDGLTPDICSMSGPLKMPPLKFSTIYSQPARGKLQWTVNQRNCRSHMFVQSRGESNWWQLVPFFSSLWQNNLRLNSWCVLWLLTFWAGRKDGWEKWVGGERGEGRHGNTAFIILSRFTPQLPGCSLNAVVACAWLTPLRSPPDCILCCARVCHLPAGCPNEKCWNTSSKLKKQLWAA